MFRRSKSTQSPPEPPTFAQILEDLDTFEVEKPVPDEVRSLEPSTPIAENASGSDRDAGLAKWWKAFETFRNDVQNMQTIRRHLMLAKSELLENSNEISKHIEDAKQHAAQARKTIRVE